MSKKYDPIFDLDCDCDYDIDGDCDCIIDDGIDAGHPGKGGGWGTIGIGGGGGRGGGGKARKQLPAPRVIEGKDVPYTTYASRTFQMAGASTSHTLHIDRSTTTTTTTTTTTMIAMSRSRKEYDGGPDFRNDRDDDGDTGDDDVGDNDVDDDGWVPCESNACSRGRGGGGGSPPPNFLNDEESLASAMIELIDESRLTLLSYHCHSLVPMGVSCAGVLLESHVAFHTWPAEGVITMDLFTCGGGLLIPTLPSIERLFAVPSSSHVPSSSRACDDEYDNDDGYGECDNDAMPSSPVGVRPTMLWSHKLRGFREGFAPGYVRSTNPLDGSLGRYVLGRLDFDLKVPLLSTRTKYQSVNVYEIADPRRRNDVLPHVHRRHHHRGDGDADESKSMSSSSDEMTRPSVDKMLFLDGIIQSTLHGDAPYHESIVHPAMMSHPDPRRVAIIGGGEGATLREVLKHRGVEEVIILEIDEELVGICREYMPEWSYCGDIDSDYLDVDATSCFDDPRASMIYADAFEWFVERFGRVGAANASVREGEGKDGKFDVIIMDALDPKTSLEIAGGLYDDNSFVDSLLNGLTSKGVVRSSPVYFFFFCAHQSSMPLC